MIYGVFNTAVSSQFLNFNVNKLTINSGTTNQNSLLNGTSLSYTRVSDAAPVVYFSKNTDLGSEGTANVHGYDGIQFRTQGAETVKGNFSAAGDFTVGATSGTGTGALYSGAITSTGAITGTSIVKSGGTSTQALIADGSVQTLTSGIYLPTATNVSNTSAITIDTAQYMRVGNVVTVSGRIAFTNTLNSPSQISITLPIATVVSAVGNVAGVGNENVAMKSAIIRGRTGTNDALLEVDGLNSSTYTIYYTYTYRIL